MQLRIGMAMGRGGYGVGLELYGAGRGGFKATCGGVNAGRVEVGNFLN